MKRRNVHTILSSLSLAGIIVFFCVVTNQPFYFLGMRAHLQEEGFIIDCVVPGSPAARAGLSAHSCIVRIQDTDLPRLHTLSLDDTAAFLESSSRLFPSGELIRMVDADGIVYTIEERQFPFFRRLRVVNRTFLLNTVIGACIVLIGLFFLRRGNGGRALFIFAQFTVFAGVAIALSYFHSYWSRPVLVARFVLLDFFGAMTVLLFLLFTREFPQSRYKKNTVKIFFLNSTILFKYVLLVIFGLHIFGPSAYFIHVFSAVIITLSVLSILQQYRLSDSSGRRQVRWIFTGLIVSVLPYLAYLFLLLFLPSYIGTSGSLSVPNILANLCLLLFPFSIGIAILEKEIFDVDLFLSRLLTVLTSVVLLSILYYLFHYAIPLESNFLAASLFILVLALGEPFFLRRLYHFFDRHINLEALQKQEGVKEIARLLVSRIRREEIYSCVGDGLSVTYHPSCISFGHWNHNRSSEDFLYTNRKSRPALRIELPVEKIAAEKPELLENGAVYVPIPTRHRESYMLIGPRSDGDIFLKKDFTQFSNLSYHLSKALDNADLYEELLRSLHDKEELIHEIHHRVKNNLQIMASLLSLQADESDRPEDHRILIASRGRINSMAFLHEMLYSSPNPSRINMPMYLETILTDLYQQYVRNGEIKTGMDIQVKSVGVDQAMLVGLIAHELISNSFRHAFSSSEAGPETDDRDTDISHSPEKPEVLVSLRKYTPTGGRGICTFSVEDNGRSLPPEIRIDAPEQLGLQLVHTLTEQLDGRLTSASEGGTRVSIEFPVDRRERLREPIIPPSS